MWLKFMIVLVVGGSGERLGELSDVNSFEFHSLGFGYERGFIIY